MNMGTNLMLAVVVGMLFVQTSAMAVSLDPDATLQRPDRATDTVLTEDVPACPLVGIYVDWINCSTGTHQYTEGMVQELTGVTVSDQGTTARSRMVWGDGDNSQSYTLRCEWAYAGGDITPLCTTTGTPPDEGEDFEHRCSLGRFTAGVAVCSIRPGPTA